MAGLAVKRDLYAKLTEWKNRPDRKPLILRGARQVGKTWLLKMFGETAYPSHVYLNFETDSALAGFFEGSLDPLRIIETLSLYIGKPIRSQETLLVFDEVQECPAALNSLKYFCEQANDWHIVAAGSLLGVKVSHTRGFPVGKVQFLDLYPLSFFEFLDATGKQPLRTFLEKITLSETIPFPLHETLLQLFKKYLFIGGMPEVVAHYVKTNDLLSLNEVHNNILLAYTLDFAKHAPKEELMKISMIWNVIPSQLAKENKKFIFSAIKKSARGRDFEVAIQWLIEAGLLYKSLRIHTPRLPLSAYSDFSVFKIFMLDTGLLCAMSHVLPRIILEGDRLFTEFHGALIENFAAIALMNKSSEPSLYYWASEHTAEVDFIFEHEGIICPIEVKAGASRHKKKPSGL